MNLIDILLAILIITASALCIALIFYVWKISNTIKAMQADVSKISTDIQPFLNSTTELLNNFKEITDNASEHLDISKDIVTSVKERVDTILQFEENVRSGIQGPVMSFIREITALYNGINTFLNYFRINKN